MNKFDMYITFIFLIKIGFIIMAVLHLYLKYKGKSVSDLDKKVLYWKERFEFFFIALMAILMIYLFNPRNSKIVMIDKETNLLLYLFGFVLIITAKWDLFFQESPIVKTIRSAVGEVGSR